MNSGDFANQILVLHAGALGDCVLTLHVIDAVQRASPESRITLAARSGFARWAAAHALVEQSCSLEAIGFAGLFESSPEKDAALAERLRPFARIISFLGGPQEKISQRLAAIVGGRLTAVDPKPTDQTLRRRKHITAQWAEDLHAAGVPICAVEHAIVNLSAGNRQRPRERLATRPGISAWPDLPAGRPIVLCHPGSGSIAKACPLEELETLVNSLGTAGCSVAWMVGPDEVERFGRSYVDRLSQTAPVLWEELVELAADLAAGADVYIGNDAGMTHVAALAGVHTIALFGPTDPRVWRPLGLSVKVMPLPCGNRIRAVTLLSSALGAISPALDATER